MKQIFAPILFAVLACCAPVQAQDAQDVKKATDAAAAWLALADTQQYAATHSGAAPMFQQAVTAKDWEQALGAARKPLGDVKRRTLKSATYQKDLPGAPAGEYVIVVYDTEFSKQPAGVETVTPMRAADGSWKVSGYFVR